MKHLIFILAIIFLISCEKGDNNNSINYYGTNCIDNNNSFIPENVPNTDNYILIFQRDSRIEINENERINSASILTGNNLVFQYRYSNDDDPMIADDEYSEVILFEIDPNLDNFILSNDNLKKTNAVYGNLCFCVDGGYHWINDGCIKGEKISQKEWQININISIVTEYNQFTKMLSERFLIDDK